MPATPLSTPALFGETDVNNRPIYEIAHEIKKDWGEKMYFGARPYVDAMCSLATVRDQYMHDSAASILRYFLSNASSWRGPVAKRIKTEILELLE